MVPSCGCCNSVRVYNGRIMVALNETASELGSCRSARSCRVTATYPQGGTGIPAGEMNYPGAAAHMQPAAATGLAPLPGQITWQSSPW